VIAPYALNVRESKFKHPGIMRESIIGPRHLGHSGLSIATGGTLERCDWDSGMLLPSKQAGARNSQSPVKADTGR
jgi:hypothetical protein